jgi:hypothetical protein
MKSIIQKSSQAYAGGIYYKKKFTSICRGILSYNEIGHATIKLDYDQHYNNIHEN